MKKLPYIFFITIVVFSCNNEMRNKEAISADKELSVNEKSLDAIDYYETPNYNELSILKEKLQDLYDKNNINSELLNIEKPESNLLISNSGNVEVENLKQIGHPLKTNDSIQHIVFQYFLKSDTNVIKDTLTAVIKTKNFIIGSDTIPSFKVTFLRRND